MTVDFPLVPETAAIFVPFGRASAAKLSSEIAGTPYTSPYQGEESKVSTSRVQQFENPSDKAQKCSLKWIKQTKADSWATNHSEGVEWAFFTARMAEATSDCAAETPGDSTSWDASWNVSFWWGPNSIRNLLASAASTYFVKDDQDRVIETCKTC